MSERNEAPRSRSTWECRPRLVDLRRRSMSARWRRFNKPVRWVIYGHRRRRRRRDRGDVFIAPSRLLMPSIVAWPHHHEATRRHRGVSSRPADISLPHRRSAAVSTTICRRDGGTDGGPAPIASRPRWLICAGEVDAAGAVATALQPLVDGCWIFQGSFAHHSIE
jgi:hypothetical protein